MSRQTPLWISLGLFCMPPLLLLLLGPLLTKPLTHHLLKAKEEELLAYQAERSQLLSHDLLAQLSRFKFDCGPQDMALLRSPDYYNRHIRFAALQPAKGQGCSTLGPQWPFVPEVKLSPSADFQLTSTAPRFDTEREMLVYARRNDNLAYWVLDSSWSHELLRTPCKGCFYLEFNHKDPALAGLFFPRGNKQIRAESSPISTVYFDNQHQVEQTLLAGQALRQYAASQIRHYGLPISLLLGLGLVLTYWLLRNYRNSLDGLLRLAMQRGEFIPFYQPIVDSRSHQVVGHEALIRWRRNDSFVPPGAFIDYVERQGLIVPITEQLVRQVVADLEQLPPPQWVSVNLVAAHVEHSYLDEMLQRLHWPDPDRLTFELTERIPITDMQRAAREMANLGLRGYHFKIDDFGTGYGGFAYLQRLGIRRIKIDKMFVDTIGTQDLKRSVLDAIIAFGRESGMEMIAEGVESQDQIDYLAERGVYLIQGYAFARPMPIAELLHWQPPVKATAAMHASGA
ncbi:EAL domain-containing protein [Aeromonas bivalvium]|uniref:EAL domain-containing protein n=1 Tax=Aeromonas bivalvium TaxID=440079 RepID=UPI000DCFBC38|nr:EAL domain-containing protein [Aeromonas bivalvium]